MPCWYFEKKELLDTPSFRDGIDNETEARYRREGARFLMDCGNSIGLRYDTMATGVVFFHRFYMFHSFNEFPRYPMATCCLFLAGKVEETPKKCRDLIRSAKSYLESKNQRKHADYFSDECIKEIMTYEKILLQTIKFDLQVDHPYSYLLKYAKTLQGNQEQIRGMVQMAWAFINDSYSTTLCLQWEPEIIAIALMYLSSKLSKFDITDWLDKKDNFKQVWWDQFVEDLEINILEDICHQILDLYATQQKQQQQGSSSSSSNKQNSLNQPNNKSNSLSNSNLANLNLNMNNTNNNNSNNKRKSPPDSLNLTPNSNTNYVEPTSPTTAKLMKTAAVNDSPSIPQPPPTPYAAPYIAAPPGSSYFFKNNPTGPYPPLPNETALAAYYQQNYSYMNPHHQHQPPLPPPPQQAPTGYPYPTANFYPNAQYPPSNVYYQPPPPPPPPPPPGPGIYPMYPNNGNNNGQPPGNSSQGKSHHAQSQVRTSALKTVNITDRQ